MRAAELTDIICTKFCNLRPTCDTKGCPLSFIPDTAYIIDAQTEPQRELIEAMQHVIEGGHADNENT